MKFSRWGSSLPIDPDCRLISIANCQLISIADCQLISIADCQLPIADCQLPIANCRLPIVGCQFRGYAHSHLCLASLRLGALAILLLLLSKIPIGNWQLAMPSLALLYGLS